MYNFCIKIFGTNNFNNFRVIGKSKKIKYQKIKAGNLFFGVGYETGKKKLKYTSLVISQKREIKKYDGSAISSKPSSALLLFKKKGSLSKKSFFFFNFRNNLKIYKKSRIVL